MTQKPTFTLIAAVAENGGIGRGGDLLFALPADLQHFKALTSGGVVLMGRKTYESLPAGFRPLPNRTNVVLTRQKDWQPHPEVVVIHDLDAYQHSGPVWVIGGAELYALTLPYAQRLELTEIHAKAEADTFFPKLDRAEWQETARTPNIYKGVAFDFVTYVRKKGSS